MIPFSHFTSSGGASTGASSSSITIGTIWAQCLPDELSLLSAALDNASDTTRLLATTQVLIMGTQLYNDLRAVFATTTISQSRIDVLLPPSSTP